MLRLIPLLSVLLVSGYASAGQFEAAGLTFSEAQGNFRLISVSGNGRATDPIVIVEEYFGPGEAILAVRGRQEHRRPTGELVPQVPKISLSIIKVVINRSPRSWRSFELELREIATRPSPYEDGLSFDQTDFFKEKPRADRFERSSVIIEPSDRMLFDSGKVPKNQAVRLKFFITDPTPTGLFYLIQQPDFPVAGLEAE